MLTEALLLRYKRSSRWGVKVKEHEQEEISKGSHGDADGFGRKRVGESANKYAD